ncbi:uncharacterized protein LOC111706071 [Eurytemora carolleeae]|uniref:uncharacterized protein LOC111706071 n=1 Tax=Eurytemora carolleeae TaxID=1294199 RepID=UPI000C77860E|nr:uncharacterized protein LOC111706071 [Eurytemora carolleeae]|eukprot:XP_023334597.1 uncharacterized protein LOC111706071 [Eurytemora affinis]
MSNNGDSDSPSQKGKKGGSSLLGLSAGTKTLYRYNRVRSPIKEYWRQDWAGEDLNEIEFLKNTIQSLEPAIITLQTNGSLEKLESLILPEGGNSDYKIHFCQSQNPGEQANSGIIWNSKVYRCRVVYVQELTKLFPLLAVHNFCMIHLFGHENTQVLLSDLNIYETFIHR